MFEISVDNYLFTLKLAYDCFKTQDMRKKAVDGYDFTLKFIPYCYSAQGMCERSVSISNITLEFDCFMIQEMCKKALFKKKHICYNIISIGINPKNVWKRSWYLSVDIETFSWLVYHT